MAVPGIEKQYSEFFIGQITTKLGKDGHLDDEVLSKAKCLTKEIGISEYLGQVGPDEVGVLKELIFKLCPQLRD